MEFTQLFQTGRFDILNEIANQKQSATDIAKSLKTSVSNVNQQLKLLEAYGYIEKEKTKQTGKAGKPKNLYKIKKEFNYLVSVHKNKVQKIKVPATPFHVMGINTMLVPQQEDHFFIVKFCLQTEDILQKCDGVAYLKNSKENVDLVILTTHLDKIRKEYSNVTISDPEGKKKKIVCWSHSEEELKKGLETKEKYYLDLLKDIIIIFDNNGVLEEVKQIRDGIR
jgi:DNA-binding PadR family transcriptional regulator